MNKTSFVWLALACLSIGTVARATVITENFTNNPTEDGWRIFGLTDLFQWDSTNHNLAVTWDSSQPNSYFYHPLGTVLTSNDAFSLAFDLQLTDVPVANGFEIAVGFFNFADATSTNFFRGSGSDSPNLAEFDYFPDFQSIDATTADTNSRFVFLYDNQPINAGVIYHIVLSHTAGTPMITGAVFTNNQLYTQLPYSYFSTNFSDFRLDTMAASSYSDANGYGASILAHGTLANIVVTVPPPPVQNLNGSFSNATWQAQFLSQSNWLYTLQRTTNLTTWQDVSTAGGNGTNLLLPDANPPADKAFYRIRADRP
jgi:hypothetical protein